MDVGSAADNLPTSPCSGLDPEHPLFALLKSCYTYFETESEVQYCSHGPLGSSQSELKTPKQRGDDFGRGMGFTTRELHLSLALDNAL